MLDPHVTEDIKGLRERFGLARPFRYVVISPFLRPLPLRRLAEEFPAFDERHARNEMGEVGRKAFRPDLPQLGPAYEELDDLLRSSQFLHLISTITAIPSLLYDPAYVGGGTHENLPGQELDPHIDFNYHPSTGWHRRLNLILFLNADWEPSWGGCLDLHSNPWAPDEDTVTSIPPTNNTCVLFETTETSWHGFRQIVPPPGRDSLSRRSIAVYFYTRERPAEEAGPSHATVYVPRPLPARFMVGKVLEESDIEDLRTLLERRNQQIRFLYEREQEYMGVLETVLSSPTFRFASTLAWPVRAIKRLFKISR